MCNKTISDLFNSKQYSKTHLIIQTISVLTVLSVVLLIPAYGDPLYSLYSVCSEIIKQYDYQITHGKIKQICYHDSFVVYIELQEVYSHSHLAIDIPYTDIPLMIADNHEEFYFDVGGGERLSDLLQMTTKHKKYQTFHIDISSNTKFVHFYYPSVATPDNYFDSIVRRTTQPGYSYPVPDPESNPCKSDLIPILSHNKIRSICVTTTTAEILVQRGWMTYSFDN